VDPRAWGGTNNFQINLRKLSAASKDCVLLSYFLITSIPIPIPIRSYSPQDMLAQLKALKHRGHITVEEFIKLSMELEAGLEVSDVDSRHGSEHEDTEAVTMTGAFAVAEASVPVAAAASASASASACGGPDGGIAAPSVPVVENLLVHLKQAAPAPNTKKRKLNLLKENANKAGRGGSMMKNGTRCNDTTNITLLNERVSNNPGHGLKVD
jgi:hypothetical protein